MTTLSIDIETYSATDLRKTGVYKYAEDPEFEITLLAYAYDQDPVELIDCTVEPIPQFLLDDLVNPDILKTAFNANFERTCLAKYTNLPMPPEQWSCTSVLALTLGLPQHLAEVGRVVGLADDQQKLSSGYALNRYFAIPCKPTKVNGGRTRNLPKHDPAKWELFKTYCKTDVVAERAIRNKLIAFDLPPEEQRLWEIDQHLNDYGVKVDERLVKNAIECSLLNKAKLEAEAIELTGLNNPNSVGQLKAWLEEAEDIEIESLNKQTVPELLKGTDNSTVKRVLELRQEMAKTSVKKYEAIAKAVCKDGRVRGLLQFYGANRTGRWAGRLVQVQNLPQNKLKDLDLARDLLRGGRYDTLEMLFGNIPDTLSQLIRTAFIPPKGKVFNVVDFSAIEARVIAWYAGEEWRMEVFATHGKIYEASASQMFHIPLDQIDKPLRQKGKVSELALGYQGGPGALITMGALKMGLTEEELPAIVKAWRAANPNIVQFWYDVGNAAMRAVELKNGNPIYVGNLIFTCTKGFLFITLPSGRKLAYVKPKIEMDPKFEREGLTYEGLNDVKKWGRLRTYGGKLVENIVQATARDCLRESLSNVYLHIYATVMHIHDEIVIEGDEADLHKIEELMGREIAWAPGLLLRGDGYSTKYYRKDD